MTARHVVADMFSPNEICETVILSNDIDNVYPDSGQQQPDIIDTVNNNIFSNMYSGSYQNVSTSFSNRIIPIPANIPYPKDWIFSNDASVVNTPHDTDIAILKLYPDYFLDTLKKRFTPISIQDIDFADNSKEGDSIMAVGYPLQSEHGFINRIFMLQLNESTQILLPTVSFGYINNFTINQYWFEGNIYINKGNSGGAVVNLKTDKLIGIVSSFPPAPKISISNKRYTTPQITFIKTSNLIRLLKAVIPPF